MLESFLLSAISAPFTAASISERIATAGFLVAAGLALLVIGIALFRVARSPDETDIIFGSRK